MKGKKIPRHTVEDWYLLAEQDFGDSPNVDNTFGGIYKRRVTSRRTHSTSTNGNADISGALL